MRCARGGIKSCGTSHYEIKTGPSKELILLTAGAIARES